MGFSKGSPGAESCPFWKTFRVTPSSELSVMTNTFPTRQSRGRHALTVVFREGVIRKRTLLFFIGMCAMYIVNLLIINILHTPRAPNLTWRHCGPRFVSNEPSCWNYFLIARQRYGKLSNKKSNRKCFFGKLSDDFASRSSHVSPITSPQNANVIDNQHGGSVTPLPTTDQGAEKTSWAHQSAQFVFTAPWACQPCRKHPATSSQAPSDSPPWDSGPTTKPTCRCAWHKV